MTGVIHRDNWQSFLAVVLPQLLEPGWRAGGLRAPEDASAERARPGSAVEQRRGARQGAAADQHLPRHAVRPRRARHGGRPPRDHAGRREGVRAADVHAGEPDARHQRRRAGRAWFASSSARLAGAARGTGGAARRRSPARGPSGIEVEILEKDTRATAISFGFPIDVTRAHPDFAALSVARAWLGEHRLSSGRLYQRIREVRGINYGDYAYIEAFPRGMFQFFPDPNVARRRQIFEIWIRPVVPANAHMTLRTGRPRARRASSRTA